jgi:hypothetical protein
MAEELVEFAQRVCQRVARLDLDRERHVGGHNELITLILEFDKSPEGDVVCVRIRERVRVFVERA